MDSCPILASGRPCITTFVLRSSPLPPPKGPSNLSKQLDIPIPSHKKKPEPSPVWGLGSHWGQPEKLKHIRDFTFQQHSSMGQDEDIYFQIFAQLSSLTSLTISTQPQLLNYCSLGSMPRLSTLQHLRVLDISQSPAGPSETFSIKEISTLTQLTKLHCTIKPLKSQPGDENRDPDGQRSLGMLTNLRDLRITGFINIEHGISQLAKLTELTRLAVITSADAYNTVPFPTIWIQARNERIRRRDEIRLLREDLQKRLGPALFRSVAGLGRNLQELAFSGVCWNGGPALVNMASMLTALTSLEVLSPDIAPAAVAEGLPQPTFATVRRVVAPACISLSCFPAARTMRLTDVGQKGAVNLSGDQLNQLNQDAGHPLMTLESLHLVNVGKDVRPEMFQKMASRFSAMRNLTVHLQGQWQADHVTNLQHFTQLTSLTLLSKTTYSGVDDAAISTLCRLKDELRELKVLGLGGLTAPAVAVLLEGLPKLSVFRFSVPLPPPPPIPAAPKEVKKDVRKFRKAEKKKRRAEREVKRHGMRLKDKMDLTPEEIDLQLMQYNFELEQRKEVAKIKLKAAEATVQQADEEAEKEPQAPRYTLAEWNAEFVRQVLWELDSRVLGAATTGFKVEQAGPTPMEVEGGSGQQASGACRKAEWYRFVIMSSMP